MRSFFPTHSAAVGQDGPAAFGDPRDGTLWTVETSSHRRLGLASALVAAHYLSFPVVGVAVCAASSWLFSGGATSPDLDNQAKYKALDKLLPDEWLGRGGPLGHRRLLHWWGLPALAVIGWQQAQPVVPVAVLWVLAGALIGWCAHLVADLVFGQGNGRVGLPRGVPLMPWWMHVGFGLKSGGALQKAVGQAAVGIAIWAALTLAPALSQYWAGPLLARFVAQSAAWGPFPG
ncbi:MAG: hypothetical protein QG622_3421 [Actinomycetota bacterium]|nr:hypothetical protein [Actinomycetota bacterium]